MSEPVFDKNGWCDDMDLAPWNVDVLTCHMPDLAILPSAYEVRRYTWWRDNNGTGSMQWCDGFMQICPDRPPTHWQPIKPPKGGE